MWSEITTDAININDHTKLEKKNSKEGDKDDFQLVINKKRKQNKRRSIVGTGKSDEIKAVTLFSHAHISNLYPDITTEKLINYLNKKDLKDVKCIQLRSNRPDEYSSFKVSVPSSEFEKLKDPNLWPEGTRINNFLFRLMKNHQPPGRIDPIVQK